MLKRKPSSEPRLSKEELFRNVALRLARARHEMSEDEILEQVEREVNKLKNVQNFPTYS